MSAAPGLSTWRLIDLSADWTGTGERIWPSIGQRVPPDQFDFDGARCMFYAGAINMLFGDSAAAKSWVALALGTQEINAGRHVVFVDCESSSRSIVQRLRSIGATEESVKLFHYIDATGAFGDNEKAYLDIVVDHYKPTVMFIDTAGESMGTEGLDGMKDLHVIIWRARLAEPYAKKGICVVEIDHTGVGWESQTRVAGSHRKRSGLTGVSIQAVEDKRYPHARGKEGHTKLICRKDREGAFAKNELVAIFVHEDDVNGHRGAVSFRVPADADTAAAQPAEPAYMRCARAVQDLGLDQTLSCVKMREALLGAGFPFGKNTVAEALSHLRAESK